MTLISSLHDDGKPGDHEPNCQQGVWCCEDHCTLELLTAEKRAGYRRTHEEMGASGWMIQHYRAGSTCNFGPWDTLEEAMEWWVTVGAPAGVGPNFIALFLDVDWNRR